MMKRFLNLGFRLFSIRIITLFLFSSLLIHHSVVSQTIHANVHCGSWEQKFKSLEYYDSIMYATTNTPVYYMFDMQYNMALDSIALGTYYPDVYRFHTGRDGHLYAVTDTFLMRKTPTGWVSTGFVPPDPGVWYQSSKIAVDDQGVIYAYAAGLPFPPGLHLTRYDGTAPVTQTLPLTFPTVGASCFVADDSGAVWIGTYDGLYRFTTTSLTQYYPGHVASNLHIDSQNRLFFSKDSLIMIRATNGFTVLDSTLNLEYVWQFSQTSKVIDSTLYIFRMQHWTGLYELAAITTSGTQYVDLSNYSFCQDSTLANLNFDYLGRYWLLGMASGNRGLIYVQDTALVQTVSGKVFHDLNLSGVFDAGDLPLQNVPVVNNFTGKVATTNSQGEYTFHFPGVIGTGYWVNQITQPPWVLTSPALFYSGGLWTNSPVSNLDFGYNTTAPPTYLDVAAFGMIFLMPPGYNSNAYFYAQNLSTFTVYNVEAWYIHDSLFSGYSSSLPPTTAGPDTAYWIIDSLTPLESKVIQITLPLDPSVAIGTPFELQFYVNHPIDTTQVNDTTILTHLIMGSFDPNDKMVHPDRPEKNIEPDELLTYTIRFQNIGNAPAINVVIRDTLSPHLDLNTLHFKGASHPYTYVINPGNELVLTFPNIYLPDSANFPIESVGAITYTIRPMQGLVNGTEIANEAYIYFDFNAPILTGKTLSYITNSPVGIQSSQRQQVWVWPNPAGEVIHFTSEKLSDGAQARVTLFDLQGRMVQDGYRLTEGNSIRIEVVNLPPGSYFGKVYTPDGGALSFRFVKAHGYQK
jgi:uncharacterized repeat protein (TIGR01451 family)